MDGLKHKSVKKGKMKFAEWRPIGVCDDGPVNEKQAKMFTRKDYLTITGDSVNRHNWRGNREVMRLIHKYAMAVAAKSTMTRGMKKPVVKDVQLVGTILHYQKTPTLSNESKDGRLQLFQVKYKDAGMSRFPWLQVLIVFLGLLLLGVGALLVIKFSKVGVVPKQTMKVFSKPVFCQSERTSDRYQRELELAKQYLNRYLQTHLSDPYGPGTSACFQTTKGLWKKETLFLECYWKGKNSLRYAPAYPEEVNACFKSICHYQKGSPFCRN